MGPSRYCLVIPYRAIGGNRTFTVYYSDGERQEYTTAGECEAGIVETVTGCSFAIQVTCIHDKDGKELYLEWACSLKA